MQNLVKLLVEEVKLMNTLGMRLRKGKKGKNTKTMYL